VTWDVDSPRVLRRLRDKPASDAPPAGVPALVRLAGDGSPEELDLREGLAAERTLIEIPSDINACGREQPQRAARWRELTRRAFGEAFATGFRVEEFHRAARDKQCAGVYVLSRRRAEAAS
jgi:predicted GNAT superfamily acetyltransferase